MELLTADKVGLQRAVELLRAGEVIGFPTDTVYGLAARAADGKAVERIFEIKARPRERALVLMPHAPSELEHWVVADRRARLFMARYWPGPLTLVLPAKDAAKPPLAGEDRTLAVRMPDHLLALQLLELMGEALATTSANLSGEEPALQPAELGALEGVAAVLDAGRSPGGRPSTILDLTGQTPCVAREGPILAHELMEE